MSFNFYVSQKLISFRNFVTWWGGGGGGGGGGNIIISAVFLIKLIKLNK